MEKNNKEIEKKNHVLFKNTFYSFLDNYGIYIFSIFITFIKARLLSQEDWGILILAISIINIINLIINFFPPGLNYSLTYFIPKYLSSKEEIYSKSIILNSIKQKLIFLAPFYLIFLIITPFLSFGYLEPLILYILSPIIIFSSLNLIFNSIFFGYNLYKTLFIITIFQYSFQILCFIFIYIISGTLDIISISIVMVIVNFSTFVVKLFIFQKKLGEIKGHSKIEGEFKEIFKNNIKYGIPITISGGIGSLWVEIKKQLIGGLLTPATVTIYNIGENIITIPLKSSISFQQPIISSFSGLDKKKDEEQMQNFFKLIFKYALLLTCLITGIFIIFAEFYIFIIYSTNYIQYTFYCQLMLLTAVPRVLGGLLTSLLQSINKTRIFPLFSLLFVGILINFFFFGILQYQLFGYAITLIIALHITFILQFKFTHTFGNIKLPIKKTITIFIIFYDSLIVSIFLINFLIPNLFLYNYIIGGFFFLLLFFGQIFLFKILSEKDLELLKSFFNKETTFDKIIRKFINFLNVIITCKKRKKDEIKRI